MATEASPVARGRIIALDLARGAALVAMAIYHFGYDLAAFGRIGPEVMVTGFWAIYARAVAGTFLFLVGIGLWLAHGSGIRWAAFLKRLAQVAAGAVLVSFGTWKLFGAGSFVFFGILHSIAVSSLIGLLFLRLPVAVTLAAAVAAFLAPRFLQTGAFDMPWLLWTGLTTLPVHAVDYVPTFPWLAPVLAGLAVAKLTSRHGHWSRLRSVAPPEGALYWLTLPGRHSLLVYLIHQPVLFGSVWLAVRLGLV
ncbi:heparan-alpha-glucosaminide N-acetyltransferase [Frigidibacter sp. RF13]|uniref:heparan-alpha-glucosaminide N-acetyltransferase n=1 Tax=Frigidibacter sp. RF13 TaxID=2997340 RepID=UPI00226FC9F2|nr:heparan-alpha-glucosaminide N-acetyltransferase [Frigidibacter sp. RF13]MCY1126523.1 heparan-alpha-glucosaminide N-acetyltransferase [Frigidibacter sp. RF13]